MKTEHHNKDIRTNSQGATHDISKELSGSENKGTYYDSDNGRVSSDRGNKGDWEKIRGQEETHSTEQIGEWYNLCSIPVNDDIFELWVNKFGMADPYIVVNGEIMGQSPNMPWLYDFKVQFDKNEACIGGEVFLTDFNAPPITFNIKDIKDRFAAGDLTYFDDFNLDLYVVNLSSPLDIPIFTELVNLGGGGGLPVGSYQYSIRYINDDGDQTNWGPLTPAIPIVQSLSPASSQYPSIMTYGGPVDLANPTSYGIKLRFRITNIDNYDFVEVRRIAYNVGGGQDFVPQGTIVAKLDVEAGEISVRDFIDPKDANVADEVLADAEEAGQLTAIDKAKAIRYYDKRLVLMNYHTPSKVASLDFLAYGGLKIFPVVQNLGKVGFNDPVAHTYKKNYASNEKYSFAINLYDSLGGSGFTVEDDSLKNVQAPSRRDRMSSDSQDLSPNGSSVAAGVDSVVGNTFEIFSHENAVSKTDNCTFKNIMAKGSKNLNVNEFCDDTEFGYTAKAKEIGYQPYRPTNKNDTFAGHNYMVNPEVSDGSGTYAYFPKAFGCDYYSRGFALGGLDNFPSWARSFSVVRSERAGRVICQGIGTYSLNKGDYGTFQNNAAASKEQNKLWFSSPDITSGLVSQATLADMDVNPQNYSVQFSSPLGFFSEVYGFEQNTTRINRDRLIDMVTYARILRDSGQINPNEDPAMGINGHVAYNRYRNLTDNAGQGAFNVPEGGNKIFPLAGFNFKSDGRSTYYEVETVESIYQSGFTGGSGNNDFDDPGMKDFTEPFYIINIIRTGAEVTDSNINSYYNTGHYQKLTSIAGLGDGLPNQSFILVDERWEDCIPSLGATSFNNGGESFIYLVDSQEAERVCFNVVYKTPAEITIIMDDINANGFYLTPGGVEVHGVYTHSQNIDGEIFLEFDNAFTTPAEDEKIIIKYDNTRPVRFFGGDTVVGENVFCPIDKESDATNSDTDQQFDFNIGFPFRRFKMNPRHYVVRKTTSSTNRIQNAEKLRLGYIRQMMIMYACESKASSSYSHNGSFPAEFFPLTHYVMRPNRWKDNSFAGGNIDDITDDNNLQTGYFDDYPLEYEIWKYGGLRFNQNYNIDYSVKGPKLYFSKPKVGFKEENEFCTGVAWSLPRAVNQQNSPGLKTFPGANRFFISDDNGSIKKAWDARTDGKGDNLYAVTSSGVALLLTKKSILSNLSANDLTTTSVDSFISDEYWISKEIGSNDEYWRGMAEGSIELATDSGKIEREALYFPNEHSVYRLMDNVIKDIAKDNYHTRLEASLKRIGAGYTFKVTGHYDKSHNEYWLEMPDVESTPTANQWRTFAFAQDTNRFVGKFFYNFDQYLYKDNKTYGFKDGKMYELDKGYLIDNDPIASKIIQYTSVGINSEKEFISIEVNTGLRGTMKPTEIKFMDESMNILSRLNQGLFGARYLRQYDGWFGQVPRKELAVSSDRDRIQYRVLVYEISHDEEEDFKVSSSVVQYKNIK